jgi:hypothetical protein
MAVPVAIEGQGQGMMFPIAWRTRAELKFVAFWLAHMARCLTLWVPENSEFAVPGKYSAFKRLTWQQFTN